MLQIDPQGCFVPLGRIGQSHRLRGGDVAVGQLKPALLPHLAQPGAASDAGPRTARLDLFETRLQFGFEDVVAELLSNVAESRATPVLPVPVLLEYLDSRNTQRQNIAGGHVAVEFNAKSRFGAERAGPDDDESPVGLSDET